MSTSEQDVSVQKLELPAVPLTLEGSAVLHQMFRFRWTQWRAKSEEDRARITAEAQKALAEMETAGSAMFSMFGHKGDVLFVHFRNDFEALNQAQLALNQLELLEYLEPASSYVSVIELGLYESTVKLYRDLVAKGVEPHSPEWNEVLEEAMKRQREAMHVRLFPQIPESRFLCFYPMDRKRGELKNWYTLPIEERQRQMDLHGKIGRRYAGKVQQFISGSIGFDDWEWGVDLFADEPVIFKKLIYEMRFDEVSGVFSNFGAFFVGIRCSAAELPTLLEGKTPKAMPRTRPVSTGRPTRPGQ
ncbi:MAG TPA: hydrogen peroxide-dependent heme synthase [Candidatus Saccharimonadales bacterium]|nr:hydrogen peroxide-dependent heme synthase [Candidatus Saccharimonadales bacterium]